MLSLANVRTPESCIAWQQRAQRLLPQATFDYVCEPKIDGLSMNLIYENGSGYSAALHAVTAPSAKTSRRMCAPSATSRRCCDGSERYPICHVESRYGARSICSAMISRRSIRVCEEEATAAGTTPRLVCQCAQLPRRARYARRIPAPPPHVLSRSSPIRSASSKAYPSRRARTTCLQHLQAWGFPVSPLAKHVATLERGRRRTATERQDHRFDVGYDIDGAVIKINARWQQQELGVVARDPALGNRL